MSFAYRFNLSLKPWARNDWFCRTTCNEGTLVTGLVNLEFSHPYPLWNCFNF